KGKNLTPRANIEGWHLPVARRDHRSDGGLKRSRRLAGAHNHGWTAPRKLTVREVVDGIRLQPEGRLSGIADDADDFAHLRTARVRKRAGLNPLSDGVLAGKELVYKSAIDD